MASVGNKDYNETDDEFHWNENDNQIYNLLGKTLFPFQTDKATLTPEAIKLNILKG